MAFKIFRKNCCGLDVHKTWIYACIGITDTSGRTEYKQARFSSFSKGLRKLADRPAKHSCTDACMESTGKYWMPVFNILENTCFITLTHPKYTKPQKGTKADRKDAKWICSLFMFDMIKPSFIPTAVILGINLKIILSSSLKRKGLHCFVKEVAFSKMRLFLHHLKLNRFQSFLFAAFLTACLLCSFLFA